MKRRLLQTVLLGVVVCLLTMTSHRAVRAEQVEQPDLPTLFARLDGAAFSERVAAQRQLVELATEHLPVIEQHAADASPELACRIVAVLEAIFLQHADETGEQAEQILQRLVEGGGVASVPAGRVLQGNAYLRESRARIALEKLGAQFIYFSPFAQSNGQVLFGMKAAVLPEIGVAFGPSAVLHSIYLHENWSGTTEDLWHLTRLTHHRDLVIYSIKGNNVDLNDLFRLAGRLRGLTIQERGPCLGIVSGFIASPCQVGRVAEGGAADKGGLLENDYILELNGMQVRSFPHLVQMLQDFKIGDEVTFTIIRQGEELEKKVTLGSWRNVSFNNEFIVDPPPPFPGPFGPVPAVTEPVDSETSDKKSDPKPESSESLNE